MSYRQTALVAILPLLFACGVNSKPLGVIGHVAEGFGAAVADEPAAALIARDALSAGGTAADAAVALYFGLAATYPIAAGLGGGGICVVRDGATAEAEVIDFTAAPALGTGGGSGGGGGGGKVLAIPANVRGMAALHARYGRLRWTQLVLPGERTARFGNRVSRAFARAGRPEAARLAADPAARAIFLRRDGSFLGEGDGIEQVSLASAIGQVRAKGAGALYGGQLARRLATGAAAIGMALPIEALRDWKPVWRKPATLDYGDHTVWTVAGSKTAALWRHLFDAGGYDGATDAAKTAAVAGAELAGAKFAVPAAAARIGNDNGTTGFVVMDRAGGAVACGLSMNGAFGTGRIIPGTGVFAATPSSGAAAEGVSLAIISNIHTGNAYFAIASSGGAASAAALVRVAGAALYDKKDLVEAVAAKRAHGDAAAGAVYAEPGIGAAALEPVLRGGAKFITRAALGRVNAIHCPEGIQRKFALCQYRPDPRGFGFAASAEN